MTLLYSLNKNCTHLNCSLIPIFISSPWKFFTTHHSTVPARGSSSYSSFSASCSCSTTASTTSATACSSISGLHLNTAQVLGVGSADCDLLVVEVHGQGPAARTRIQIQLQIALQLRVLSSYSVSFHRFPAHFLAFREIRTTLVPQFSAPFAGAGSSSLFPISRAEFSSFSAFSASFFLFSLAYLLETCQLLWPMPVSMSMWSSWQRNPLRCTARNIFVCLNWKYVYVHSFLRICIIRNCCIWQTIQL